jgi:quercetin dioxygenase-like cupin family protein
MGYCVYRSSEAEDRKTETDWGALRWLAGKGVGNARGLTLGRVTIKAGKANPAHSHGNCEEALYLLAGRLKHFAGEVSVILEAGDTLTVSAGVPHHAVNIGEEDADMIVAYSSGEREVSKEC